MKKNKSNGLRTEYNRKDLGVGVRGKYLEDYKKGTNLVLIYPDIAKVFPTEESVNKALRTIINSTRRTGITISKRSIAFARRHKKSRTISQQVTNTPKSTVSR